ncbi:MAG: hypothetical protein ACK4E8_03810 [Lacibacter sp.]
MKKFLVIGAGVLLLHSCRQNPSEVLYQSEAYTLYPNKVVQGSYKAEAISRTCIRSTYRSPAGATYSRLIKYKFSLNEQDNELPPGQDHWVIIGNEKTAPLVVFGTAPPPLPEEPTDPLPPNYRYTFQVDMRPVLQQFEEKGYYECWDGSRISKTDFKGVFIAGGAEPLSWEFVNLAAKNMQLHDADGDGIYNITLTLNPYDATADTDREWKQTLNLSQRPVYTSEQPLVDALFNLSMEEAIKNMEPDSTFRTGAKWGGVWTRDISYSIFLAFAYHQPDIAKISLLKKVKRKRIIQDTGSGGAWPVSSDRTTWALAAWELYKVTGDRNWLQQAFEIIRNTLEDDAKVLPDAATGLYRGESSFLDWREQTYPRWMDNADIYQSLNLGTNVVHYQAHRIAALMAKELQQPEGIFEQRAEELKNAINRHLWMADKGLYAQYIYGRQYPIVSPRFEALGSALSVLFDVADEQQATTLLQKAPLTPFGVTCIYPQIPGIPPYHNNSIWPFVQAYWNLAAAKAGNEAVLRHGLASIYRAGALFLTNYENMVAANGDYKGTEMNSDRMLWSMAGNLAMVHRVFMGMHFEPNGIRFAPAVPTGYTGTKRLQNFRYRNAVLDITVTGTGNRIRSFRINGQPAAEPFFPANLTGAQQIEMELDNRPFAHQKINLVANAFSPATPRAQMIGNLLQWESVAGARQYRVLQNGKEIATTAGNSFSMPQNETAEFQVMAIAANGVASFASEPVLFVPEGNSIRIEMEEQAPPSRLQAGQFSGAGFVETDKGRNASIRIAIQVPEAGAYRVDFRYANGSGPWNTDNKCAIRTLYCNKKFAGTVVFPQRGKNEWSNWGFSNGNTIPLKQGRNELELVLEPWNENMDGTVNRALLDYVRLIKL